MVPTHLVHKVVYISCHSAVGTPYRKYRTSLVILTIVT
jgi:hypothetical protein